MNQQELNEMLLDECKKEIELERAENKKVLNEQTIKKLNLVQRVWYSVVGKLLYHFKVKVTLYYKDKIIFEYTIPKN